MASQSEKEGREEVHLAMKRLLHHRQASNVVVEFCSRILHLHRRASHYPYQQNKCWKLHVSLMVVTMECKPKWRMDETHEQFSDIEPQVVSTEISRVIEASKHIAHPRAEVLRQKALDDYAQTTFRPEIYPDPPIRGCFGEAKILPKVGIQPAAQRPMRLCGKRCEALISEVKNG